MNPESSYRWHIVTGEYPPQPGGVSDYTRLVAKGLVAAGDEVQIWAPECDKETPKDEGIVVHRLPGHFGPRALSRLTTELEHERQNNCRLLVQYVPQMYGWKGMNLPFCLWLLGRRHQAPWIMFHEVAVPISRQQNLLRNVLGVVNHLMASLVVRGADKIFVSIPTWEKKLRKLAPVKDSITWLPVPSNVSIETTAEAVEAVRKKAGVGADKQVIGHFGTYGAMVANPLLAVLPRVLKPDPRRIAFLLGRNSNRFAEKLLQQHPDLQSQIVVGESLAAADIAAHLKACDLLFQPYTKGVCSRRGSVMAGLALGLPIVTNQGIFTEPEWHEDFVELAEEGNVEEQVRLAEQLFQNETRRRTLALQSRLAYQKYFCIDRTIQKLRATA